MLSKRDGPSDRIAGKRIGRLVAVSFVLLGLAFTGQAGAQVTGAGALSSVAAGTEPIVTTEQSSAAASAIAKLPYSSKADVVPVSTAVTPSVGTVVAPATKVVAQDVGSTTQSVGSVVVPATKVVAQSVGSTTPSVGSVVAPATKVVAQSVGSTTQSAGSVVAPATKVAAQGVGSTTQAPVVASLIKTATHGTGSVVAPATKVTTRGVGSTSRPIAATTGAATTRYASTSHGAPDTVAQASASSASSGGGRSTTPPGELLPGTGALGVAGFSRRPLACPLGQLGERTKDSCGYAARLTVSLPGLSVDVAPTAITLGGPATAPVSRARREAPPPAGGPPSPGPSPSPGGVVSGSAAGAGVGFLILLTLAGLLALGPPGALRRLRLAAEPLGAAPFVLIPEHPG